MRSVLKTWLAISNRAIGFQIVASLFCALFPVSGFCENCIRHTRHTRHPIRHPDSFDEHWLHCRGWLLRRIFPIYAYTQERTLTSSEDRSLLGILTPTLSATPATRGEKRRFNRAVLGGGFENNPPPIRHPALFWVGQVCGITENRVPDYPPPRAIFGR